MAQVTITGMVGNIGWEGKRVSVWETYEIIINNQTYEKKRLWTIWFDRDQNLIKDIEITLTGQLSTKMGEYDAKDGTKKTVVEHSLNNAEITWRGVAAAPAPAQDLDELPF